jgi:hypothetical protein
VPAARVRRLVDVQAVRLPKGTRRDNSQLPTPNFQLPTTNHS